MQITLVRCKNTCWNSTVLNMYMHVPFGNGVNQKFRSVKWEEKFKFFSRRGDHGES